ncbi:MAG TPA: hypothetical protein VFO77_05725, partial [Actinoplanes sp.]|nr:hypothetical protein [Actinoplanes sp.]
MTISGIDTTGQSAGGGAFEPRGTTDLDDLDAELLALEAEVAEAAPTVLPEVRDLPEVSAAPQVRPGAAPTPQRLRRPWRPLTRGDVFAIASFIAVALFLTASLWFNLDHELREDPQDQAFFEWMLAHGARVLTDGAYPFFSDRMNYPDGVNMMANTSVLAISLPMTPITVLFGPHVAFNVFLTLALAVTGISWYFVLSRRFVASRTAAWVGALFCTFAPSMVSHAAGHPNIVSQFLVPLIIWRTLELRVPGRAVRNGLLMAGLLVWQAFINLEVLFMTAVGLGIFCTVLAVARRRTHPGEITSFLRGLAVVASVSLVLLAYPLWVQFFGPQAYHGLPEFVRGFGADLGSFTAYARRSVAGDTETAMRLTQNPSEENAFFGWGLLILFVGLVCWMRRSVAVLALAFIGVLFAAMSLGPTVRLNGDDTGVAGIWALLHSVPVLNSAVPTRWAMAIAPVIGIVLALGCQKAYDLARSQPTARRPVVIAMIVAVAMALVPLAPTPLLTEPMDRVPGFVTSGAWRAYVDDQHTVVTLPLPDSNYPDPLRWSAYTGHEMRIAGAYALLPNSDPLDPTDRTALFSPPWRPTAGMMTSIRNGSPPPKVTDPRRDMTLADLRFWRAGVIVLAPQDRDVQLRRAMTDILRRDPVRVDGAWVWDVRDLVDNPAAT